MLLERHRRLLLPTAAEVTVATTRQYVIVSPIRNEAAHLAETIAAVVSQTIKPAEWVLVDEIERCQRVIADEWAGDTPG